MAPLPTVPGVVRTDIKWNDGVASFGSRIFLQLALVTLDADALGDLSSAVNEAIQTNIISLISSAYTFVGTVCTDIGSVTGAEAGVTVNVACSGGGEDLPSNVTMDAQLKIADRYRGGHPVTHWPPPPSNDLQNPRQWSTATTGVWNLHLAALLGDINAITVEGSSSAIWTVLRGYRPGALPEQVTLWPVNSQVARQNVGTMRRRARALR